MINQYRHAEPMNQYENESVGFLYFIDFFWLAYIEGDTNGD